MGSNEHRKASPEHQKADPAERTHLMQEVVELVAGGFGQQDEHEYLRLRSYLYHDVFQHLQEDPGMRLWVAHRLRKRQDGSVNGAKLRSQLVPSDLLLPKTEPFRIELEKTREDCNQMVHQWLENINFVTQHSVEHLQRTGRVRRERFTFVFDLSLTLPFVAPSAHKNATWRIRWFRKPNECAKDSFETEWYHNTSSEPTSAPLLSIKSVLGEAWESDWAQTCEWLAAHGRKPPPVLEWNGPE